MMNPGNSEIVSAKNKAVGGKKDRCRKGKSCSATCISSWKQCLVEMSAVVSGEISRFSKKVKKAIPGETRNIYLNGKRESYNRVRQKIDDRIKETALTGDYQGYEKLKKRALDLHSKVGRKLGVKWSDPDSVWLPIAKNKYLKDKAEALDKIIKAAKNGDKAIYGKLESSFLKKQEEIATKVQDNSFIGKGSLWDKHSPAFDISRPDRFDKAMDLESLKREGDKNYNGWPNSHSSPVVGSGLYGQVSIDSNSGFYIKRGVISNKEASLIKLLGDNDLGPKLVAADLDGIVKPGSKGYEKLREEGVVVVNGRIAMTPVSGVSFNDSTLPTKKINNLNVADIYWKAMAGIHRLGIAHNDAHPGNIFIDDKGKGRWVDLGLSQKSFKAALSEALGSFFMGADGESVLPGNPEKFLKSTGAGFNIGEGNWQSMRWMMTGLYDYMDAVDRGGATMEKYLRTFPILGKISQNVEDVRAQLRKIGFNDDESAALQMYGIRASIDLFDKGIWGKITESQAEELVNILYKGI